MRSTLNLTLKLRSRIRMAPSKRTRAYVTSTGLGDHLRRRTCSSSSVSQSSMPSRLMRRCFQSVSSESMPDDVAALVHVSKVHRVPNCRFDSFVRHTIIWKSGAQVSLILFLNHSATYVAKMMNWFESLWLKNMHWVNMYLDGCMPSVVFIILEMQVCW